MRLILDTNLWISFLISSRYDRLDKLLVGGKYKLLFSSKLLAEFVEVAQHPKFQKYIPSTDLDDLLATIDSVAEFVDVSSSVEICRDPKDNFLLNLAIEATKITMISYFLNRCILNSF